MNANHMNKKWFEVTNISFVFYTDVHFTGVHYCGCNCMERVVRNSQAMTAVRLMTRLAQWTGEKILSFHLAQISQLVKSEFSVAD